MKTIEILGRHTSYNVQKVLWLADELKLDYTHEEVGGRFGGLDDAEFLASNPHGKVPVVRYGTESVWESNAIVRFLAESAHGHDWISSNPFNKSLSDRWMDWSISEFEPAFVGVFWGFYRTLPENRDTRAIERSVKRSERCLSQLSEQLSNNRFLLGAVPSVADIATGVFLHRLWSIELKIAFPENVERWYHELCKRKAYERWVMSDFSELEGRSDA